MFTGIITDVGKVVERMGAQFRIKCGYDPKTIELGASIAANGVCLTVTKLEAQPNGCLYDCYVSPETFAVSNADGWQEGTRLNLERALKMGDEFGGHIVSGHVDGLAKIVSKQMDEESTLFALAVESELALFVASKGSVTLDGVSLTVNQVEENSFSVNIIPHTIGHTNLGDWDVGSQVNIEIDMLARYCARISDFNAAIN